MAVSKLFSKDTNYISRKRMRENYQYDPAFREIMRDPAIAKVLNQPDEQRRFHDRLVKAAGDGKLDLHDMRKIAYEAAHGKIKDISSKKGYLVARSFFPDSSRRYEHDAPERENSQDKTLESQDKSVGKTNKVPPATIASHVKSLRTSFSTGKMGNKKSSYFDALRSVRRNK